MTAQPATPKPETPSDGADQKPHILRSLPSQARVTGKQAVAHSRHVKNLRIALPILALVLVAALLLNTRSKPSDQAFLNDFSDISTNPEELRMANPRFAGVDSAGKPYVITAQSAKQNPDENKLVELEYPRAVTHGGDEQSIVTANKGVFQSETNVLELNDGVTLEHSIGSDKYVLRTPAATVLIDEKTVTSDTGITGEGPAGETLRADRMRAYNEDGKIVFEGNVSMRIFPKALKAEPENSVEVKTGEEPQ